MNLIMSYKLRIYDSENTVNNMELVVFYALKLYLQEQIFICNIELEIIHFIFCHLQ